MPRNLSRRTLLLAGSVLATASWTSARGAEGEAWPSEPAAPPEAPNILLIMTDDVGFGASSTFGGPVPTPTLDALAATGLRYNRFHTEALCSPSRAALLTGRNPHSVGFGTVPELPNPAPGYTTAFPPSVATFAEVFREHGYDTAMFGKHHNTPQWEMGPAGPFDRWPTGLGFNYFYGFLGGQTDHFSPALVENTNIVEPPHGDPTYILDRDMADRAVEWLQMHNSAAGGKPFLLYYAPGTSHAPHQAPREAIDRFKGQFNGGWDAMREATFVRQKKLGVIPADAELTARPASIPAWDAGTPEEKRLYARMMEVYAGALSYCDQQISRIIDEIKDEGKYDNTLIIFIQGDNGASGEGGVSGTTNQNSSYVQLRPTTEQMIDRLDLLGGPFTSGNYPVGWAWAMNTPFQYAKGVAGHLGGTRNGMVISWPARIKERGGLRQQYLSIVDIAPTLYEAAGIAPPQSVRGIPQRPLDGISFHASFADAAAPSLRLSQYFEIFGNMGYYQAGWMISRHPVRLPWLSSPIGQPVTAPSLVEWELYHLERDYSQANDIRQRQPEKVALLAAGFQAAAERNKVYPLPVSDPSPPPFPYLGAKRHIYHQGQTRLSPASFPSLGYRDWTVISDLNVSATTGDGVIFAVGDRFGGMALTLDQGHAHFLYRFGELPGQSVQIVDGEKLTPGDHIIDVEFRRTPPGAALIRLRVDRRPVGEAMTAHAFNAMNTWADIGCKTGAPIGDDGPPPQYDGVIRSVEIVLDSAATSTAE